MKDFAAKIQHEQLFDENWYLDRYGDVRDSGVDPLLHFVTCGRFEGRSPSSRMDFTWYKTLYGDQLNGIDPCEHYLFQGKEKGYIPSPPYIDLILNKGKKPHPRNEAALLLDSDQSSEKTKGILIRTYDADAYRLYYTLLSIGKYCSGFNTITVVCQYKSIYAIKPVVDAFDFVTLKICDSYENDYIGQQITKLRSYEFMDDDIIFHIDSDCLFTDFTHLSHYLIDDLPILFLRSYDFLYRNFAIAPWQEPTSRFLRRQVDFEFMCGFPFAYPRELYIDLHQWFIGANKFDYNDIEKHLPYKDNFSEFNLLGAFSYYSEKKYNTPLIYGEHEFDFRVHQFCNTGNRVDRTISPEELKYLQNKTTYGNNI